MESKRFNVPIPSYFRCPISLEIMRDPVTLSTGITYDRRNIEKWIQAGHSICPVSGQAMGNFELIPNITLRSLIHNWCTTHCSPQDRNNLLRELPSPANANQVREMLDEITAGKNRIFSLQRLLMTAQEFEENRKNMIEEGAIPILGSLLAFHSISRVVSKLFFSNRDPFCSYEEDNNVACEEALGTLALLAKTPASFGRMSRIAGPRQMNSLAWFLSRGSLNAKVNAASVLESMILDDDSVAENGRELEGILRGLLGLLKEADLHTTAMKTSLRSLHGMCLPKKNRSKAVEAGVVGALLELLPGSDRAITEIVLAILEKLSTLAEGRAAVTKNALAIPLILRSLLQVSGAATEHAVTTLRTILMFSADTSVHHDALQAGAFMQLLLVIQSDCSSLAKRTSREVLKLLRASCTSDPCIQTIIFNINLDLDC